MAIDPNYIPAFSIEDVLLDKDTGAPLTGGQVYFEQDNNRGVLKPIYQITGTSPDYTYTQLPNPMTLSAIGTFEDAMGNPVVPYFFPYDSNFDPEYYFVRVESSGGVPQFTREAVPYIPTSSSTSTATAFENEISNPQFSEVVFDTISANYVYNFNTANQEVVPLAPDWDLVVSSAAVATVTVSQTRPTGALNVETNPGTLLNINSAGVSRLRLRQRIYGSPNLWGGGYLAGSFLAKTFGGTATTVTMYYSQSNGSVVDQAITSGTLNGDGTYDTHPGSVLIPGSDSAETFPDAYIDIELELPLGTQIELSSIMLSFTGANSVADINYDQPSQNRQIDHLFHYYKPQLDFKAIPSMLVGWDFPLNPSQFGSSGNLSASNAYILDQTIASRGATNIAYTRNSVTNGLQFTTAGAVPDAFQLIQYLSGSDVKKMLGTTLSVNMNAFRGSAGGAITYRIYLFRGSSAAVIPTLPNTIGSLATSGVFTKNNTAGQGLNWTEIPRANYGEATGTLSTVTTNDDLNNGENDYGFPGWEITDAAEIADTDKFAIVVTFSYAAASTVVTVNSISLVPGLIPTRPAPQTIDEVFRECQRYYETSFAQGITVPSASTPNLQTRPQNYVRGGTDTLQARGFSIEYQVPKRVNPNVTLYSGASSTADRIEAYLQRTGALAQGEATFSSFWGVLTNGRKGVAFSPSTNANVFSTAIAGAALFDGYVGFHYIADARLGIV